MSNASLQGSIELRTDTIQQATDRINELHGKLRDLTSATKAFERADKQRAQSQAASSKAAKDTSAALVKASNTISNYNQAIQNSVKNEAARVALQSRLNDVFNQYSLAVKKADGDTVKLSQAKLRLEDSISAVNRAAKQEKYDYSQSEKAAKSADKLSAANQKVADSMRSAQANVAALEQRITKSTTIDEEQVTLKRQLSAALEEYGQKLQDANGDAAKMASANKNLSTSMQEIRTALGASSKTLTTNKQNTVATEKALGRLEITYQRARIAIKNTTLTEKDQAIQLERLKRDYEETSTALRKYGANTLEATQANNKFILSQVRNSQALRNNLKNVGQGAGQASIQMQQFVGQIQGGVNPMIALSQQSADLGFALGVPMVGAIAGIAFSLGSFLNPALFESKSAADKLEDSVNNLNKTATVSTDGIVKFSDEIRELARVSQVAAQAQLTFAMLQAKKAAEEAGASISEAFSNLDIESTFQGNLYSIIESLHDIENTNIDTLTFEQSQRQAAKISSLYKDLTSIAKNLGTQLGATGKDAQELGTEFVTMLRNIKADASVENILQLRDRFNEVVTSSNNVDESVINMIQSILDASEKARKAGEVLEFVNQGLDGIARQSFANIVNEITDQMRALIMSERELTQYNASLEGLNPEQLKVIKNLLSQLDATKAKNSLDELIASTVEQARTINMSARALTLYKAVQLNATQADIDRINALYDGIEAQQESNKTTKVQISDTEKLLNSTAEQVRALVMSSREQAIYKLQLAATTEELKAQLPANIAAINAMYDSADAAKKDTEAKKLAQQQQEKLSSNLNKLKQDLQLSKLALEGNSEAAFQLKTAFSFGASSFDELSESAKKTAKEIYKVQQQLSVQNESDSIVASLRQDLATQEQLIIDSYQRRREIILADTRYTEEEKGRIIAAMALQTSAKMVEIQEQQLVQNQSFWQRWLESASTSMQTFDMVVADSLNQFSQNFGNSVGQAIAQGSSAIDMFRSVFQQLAQSVVSGIASMAAQWLVYNTIQKTVQSTGGATKAASMIAEASALVPLASLRAYTFGAAFGPAAAGAAAGAAATTAGTMAATVASIAPAMALKDGGYVSGPGSATSDSINARLSNGEFVMNAGATSMIGSDMLEFMNRTGKVPMLASGGMVGTSSSSANSGNYWGEMTVQIVNEGNTGMEVTNTEQTFGEDGEPMMKVYIREVVRQELGSGYLDRGMNRNYGVTRKPTRR